jgi:hypothetical protein
MLYTAHAALQADARRSHDVYREREITTEKVPAMKTLSTLILAGSFVATGCAAIIGEPKARGEVEYVTGTNIPRGAGAPVSPVSVTPRERIERDNYELADRINTVPPRP